MVRHLSSMAEDVVWARRVPL